MRNIPTLTIRHDDAYLVTLVGGDLPTEATYAARTRARAETVATAWAEKIGWHIYGWDAPETSRTATATLGRPDADPCPDCGDWIPSNDAPGVYPGALSRTREDTYICSACGHREALEDLHRAEARRYLYDA